ncbi:MAG: hypothetical protein C0500_13560 [Sphingobium sp.]|nr:hypothetical protein [Sphingobium sp.]
MTTFFDTSVVMALADPDHANHAWSLNQFVECQAQGPILINDIVYAEFSAGMENREAVDAVVGRFGFERTLRDDTALFEAGQRYARYKDINKGPKLNVLADFFIGAAAKVLGVPLVTANPKDFRRFFSGLIIVHPNGEEIVP